ncbi:MAG: GGDEF domain-containing protein [Magnetococcales bacterium]|nr:GGDEF domain-containing protein [Magnetococcales bacterium]
MMDHKITSREFDTIHLFNGVGRESIDYILDQCSIIEFPPQHVLLSPERGNDRIYVLLDGKIQINLTGTNSNRISDMGPGECVGEMSLIDSAKASAWVVTTEPSRFLMIGQNDLWSLIRISHRVCLNLLLIMTRRMRFSNDCIVEGKRRQDLLEYFSRVDPLTGLFNRSWFDTSLTRQMKRVQHNGSSLALMMLDVDDFNAYNEDYGHLAGDYALVALAKIIEKQLRSDDLASRYGGNEFSLILPEIATDRAEEVAQRLRTAVAKMSISDGDGKPLPSLTISVGVAMLADGDTAEQLTARADAALSRAKDAGRNAVRVSSMD